MGTRNLTVVIHKGEVRVAQYGQFDGYPNGVGADIAQIITKYKPSTLRRAIAKCTFISSEEIKKRWHDAGADPESDLVAWETADRFKLAHPQLSRDNSGGKVLDLILKGNVELSNQIAFAADSLFCEWAYVVDLDKEVVEVYKGFNTTKLTEKDRFFSLQKPLSEEEKQMKTEKGFDEYFPVKLAKKIKFKNFTASAMGRLEKALNKDD